MLQKNSPRGNVLRKNSPRGDVLKKNSPRGDVLKGTGFSPYVTGHEELAALAAEGM
jgi:hypothetical protein